MTRKTKRNRLSAHTERMTAFTAFLDGYWPLWRQHEGWPRYNDLKAAFFAGWTAA